ncbi:oxidation resistance protein 1 isoform X1 [Vitis riparia]|uniref:oxidation resistance protein 1 isoform X1 n=1 Tax=Vitis riparia TaxID=96939 RepID=UPI00155A983A|nr:oxidation resistance protein 1 isoform X1 [Vitis riparia]
MYFKDKLSRFWDDSSSSPSQARPSSKGGRSLSSLLSFVLPSARFDGFRSNKHQPDIRPIRSLPVRWSGKNVRHDPLASPADYSPVSEKKGNGESMYKNKGTLDAPEEDEDHGSGRSTSSSDVFEEATELHSSENPAPNLTDNSSFISSDLYEFLLSSLPNIVKGCQWVLLYSTLKHGISLRTLIRKSADLSGPCLLIVGDMQGAVFGGLLECPLKPTAKRKYQGTNQAFVFTTIYGEPRLFRPTGANRYFYLCLNDLLALGGGGNFALCLDEDLLSGTSGPCETFGNLCLAHNPEFELKNVELWGFTHSSQYLL